MGSCSSVGLSPARFYIQGILIHLQVPRSPCRVSWQRKPIEIACQKWVLSFIYNCGTRIPELLRRVVRIQAGVWDALFALLMAFNKHVALEIAP